MSIPHRRYVLSIASLLPLITLPACSSTPDEPAASQAAASTTTEKDLFCPRDLVPRADMAMFLEKMKRGRDFVPPPAKNIYTDVPRDSLQAAWIEQLAADGITKGTSPTTFAPTDTVPREQMAAFIVRLLRSPDFARGGPSRFTDVTAFVGEVEELADMGITKGCTATEFCPHDMVPRDQMAAFLMRAIHPGPDPQGTLGRFADVESNFVLAGRIEQAVDEGIMGPCGVKATIPQCPDPTSGQSRYYAETGHSVSSHFLAHMDATGGVAGVGYPITDTFSSTGIDGLPYTTQCFERRALELHPENSCGNLVLGRQLGRIRFETKYPSGAVEQWKTTDPGRTFPETGFTVSNAFLRHWDETGGLAENGYPLSEEIEEDGYIVQYFERAVFQYHPESADPAYEVQGLLLGLMDPECSGRAGTPVPLGAAKPPSRDAYTTDRTAFLMLGTGEGGMAQVSHKQDKRNPIDCSTDYSINYFVQVGETTDTSVFIKSVTVYYHPPAGTVIWPWALQVWSDTNHSFSYGDEVGVPKKEGDFHTFQINRNFPVKPSQGAVIEFPTGGNSGALPLYVDTSGSQCGRKGVIVVEPRR